MLRRNSQSCILPSQTFQYLPTPISNSGSTTFIEIQPILQKGIQNCPIEGACEITTEQNFLNMEGTDWPTFGSAFSKLDKTLLCRLEMDIRNRIFWREKNMRCQIYALWTNISRFWFPKKSKCPSPMQIRRREQTRARVRARESKRAPDWARGSHSEPEGAWLYKSVAHGPKCAKKGRLA